jgi:hypothetical protein
MKEIHWVDLDDTLWRTNAKWWIVDKKNPLNYIMRIDKSIGDLIMNGKYIHDGHKITYNGIEAWLSNDLLTEIKQRKNIDIDDIGISFREFINSDLIINQLSSLFIYVDRFKHIKSNTINILTARGNKKGHEELLKKLDNELNKYNIKINNSVFVSDGSCVDFGGSISELKLKTIIQSIVGFKIKNDKFEPIVIESSDVVHFYDDELENHHIII